MHAYSEIGVFPVRLGARLGAHGTCNGRDDTTVDAAQVQKPEMLQEQAAHDNRRSGSQEEQVVSPRKTVGKCVERFQYMLFLNWGSYGFKDLTVQASESSRRRA